MKSKTTYEKCKKRNKGLCSSCHKMIYRETNAMRIIKNGYIRGWYHSDCVPKQVELSKKEPIKTKKETTTEYLKRTGAL